MRSASPRPVLITLSAVMASLALSVFVARPAEEYKWEAPAADKARPNPTPADAASVARGKELYVKNCQSCHGEKGDGFGPVAQRLGFMAGDLTDAAVMAKDSDGALAWKIATGRDPMPAFKKDKNFTNAQIWDAVNFTRTFAAPAAQTQPKKP